MRCVKSALLSILRRYMYYINDVHTAVSILFDTIFSVQCSIHIPYFRVGPFLLQPHFYKKLPSF